MKRFEYNYSYFYENIKELYEAVPFPFLVGKERDWYRDTRRWCEELANREKLPIELIVGIFSALSPQNSVKGNKMFLEAYLKGVKKHTSLQNGKADRILALHGYQYESIEDILGGEKTKSFYSNILNPNSDERCTIDRHMLLIAGLECSSLTQKQYIYLEQVFKDVAKEVSLIASELQAILWCYYRGCNNKNIYD